MACGRAHLPGGIATGNATFEASWDEFDREKAADLRLVAIDGDTVVGWAAAGRVSSRCVYEGVIEHSVYGGENTRGAGMGIALLDPSLALHRKLGFRDVGTRELVGKMSYGPYAGQWRDVVMIEHRSAVAGRD